MSYLFSFEGRINRAKLWLFLLVTIAWEIVIGLIAVFGLSWTKYLHAIQIMVQNSKAGYAPGPAPMPWPDPISGTGWTAIGVIALLVLLYFVAFFAVYTKRLHDRNKSIWWLVPYAAIPWALNIFIWTTGASTFPVMGLWVGPFGAVRGVAYIIGVIISLWVFVELYCFLGTSGENRFGPDPLPK